MKESGKFNVGKHLENIKKTNERMGKLKALLEEYNNIITGGDTRGDTRIGPRVTLDLLTSGGWCFSLEGYLVLISKEYGFIKRLVENDKIDFTKLEDNSDWYSIELGDDCCEVLALLSIQDNPIEFLISILK